MRTVADILKALRAAAETKQLASMSRLGINTTRALGVPVPALRRIARELGRNHSLAQDLWRTGIHEARILATLVDEPAAVTATQMDLFAVDIDSWDLCDAVCVNLFVSCGPTWSKIRKWSRSRQEYVKRCAFTLMAALAIHDKKRSDDDFCELLQLIERSAKDERKYVKRAVSWALRQIGKRNSRLRHAATVVARRMALEEQGRWAGTDALKELQRTPYVRRRSRRALTSGPCHTRKVTASPPR